MNCFFDGCLMVRVVGVDEVNVFQVKVFQVSVYVFDDVFVGQIFIVYWVVVKSFILVNLYELVLCFCVRNYCEIYFSRDDKVVVFLVKFFDGFIYDNFRFVFCVCFSVVKEVNVIFVCGFYIFESVFYFRVNFSF